MYYQIAIDGVSGVGKSAVAEMLASELNFLYVNTGFFFRGIAYYVLNSELTNIEEIVNEIKEHKRLIFIKNKVVLNRQDITHHLFNDEISLKASELATHKVIRDYVLLLEKQSALYDNIVMEGRDIGSVVFPDAFLKVFLNASVEVRADRRYKQLLKLNQLKGLTMEEIAQSIKDRDYKDMTRTICPLMKTNDSFEVECDELTVDEVVKKIVDFYKAKLKASKASK